MGNKYLLYEDFLALSIDEKMAMLEASQEAAVILSNVAAKLKTKPDKLVHKIKALVEENQQLKLKVEGFKNENKRTKTSRRNSKA